MKKKTINEILTEVYTTGLGDGIAGRTGGEIIIQAETEIKALYDEDEIVTFIVDKLAEWQKNRRFKLNAKMSGKNWTIANWLAHALKQYWEVR